MVAFMLSALMTVGAVFYSYLSDSMPKAYLTETDEEVIADFQRLTSRFKRSAPALFVSHCWIEFCELVLRRAQKQEKIRHKLTREQREAAVTRFILSLSDQQLVVGVAILIAAVANQHTMTVAEFWIAFSLAWFSATTHLATLDTLQQYFRRNTTLRNWRVRGILLLMAVFIYCFGVVLFIGLSPSTVPVQCYYVKSSRQSLMNDPSRLGYGLGVSTPLLLYLTVAYLNRVLHAYAIGIPTSIVLVMIQARALLIPPSSRELRQLPLRSRLTLIEEAKLEYLVETRSKLLECLDEPQSRNQFLSSSQTLLQKFQLSSLIYDSSTVSVFPPLIFMLTYGFTQMAFYRWRQANIKDINDMGFGQIMPLVLLVLPVLAAAESYHGMCDIELHVAATN
jgi:hypothetical protein